MTRVLRDHRNARRDAVVVAQVQAETHVVDDHAQLRIAGGKVSDGFRRLRHKNHERDAGVLRDWPKPIGGAIRDPRPPLMVERKPYTQHALLLLPAPQFTRQIGAVELYASHDGETIRMLGRSFESMVIARAL